MKRAIIVGCGYAGLATAREFLRAGWDVLGLVHSEDSAERLRGEAFRVAVVDISDAESVARVSVERGADVMIHCASSSQGGADAYEAVYRRGSENLITHFEPKRFIFTSSTSVYAQTDGGVVTEQSPAEPSRETGRILRETEEYVLAKGGIVARLAGIYGPGRSVLLRKFFSGEAVIEGDGSRVINQIHRNDIATALLCLAESGAPGIYNVSDNAPIAQRDLYAWLSAHFQMPIPPSGPIDPNRKRGWTSKRVTNEKLRALGWTPQYPSFERAVIADDELVTLAKSAAKF